MILRGHYVQLQVILSNSEVNKGKMDHKKSRKIYFVLRYSGASKAREWCRNVMLEKPGSRKYGVSEIVTSVLETYIDKRRDRTSELVSYRKSSPPEGVNYEDLNRTATELAQRPASGVFGRLVPRQ